MAKKSTITTILVFLSFCSFAIPTPVAMWDGDFTIQNKGAYTLNLNENTLNEASVTISQTQGVQISKELVNIPSSTILIKGSSLPLNKRQILCSVFKGDSATNNRHYMGAYKTDDNKICGIAQSSSYGSASNSTVSESNSKYLAFQFNNNGATTGTRVFAGASEGELTQIYENGGLKYSNQSYQGFSIGGFYDSSAIASCESATGWQIEAVAVFEGNVTLEELKTFKFPSVSTFVEITNGMTTAELQTALTAANTVYAKIANNETRVTFKITDELTSVVTILGKANKILKLENATVPSATTLEKLNFSLFEGTLERSWIDHSSIGFNFHSNEGSDTTTALATNGHWIALTGGSGEATSTDGLSKYTWSARGTWAWGAKTSFMHGYLDDDNQQVNTHTKFSLSHVPYEFYDVIVYAAGDSAGSTFKAKTINGVSYVWDTENDKAKVTSDPNEGWGQAMQQDVALGVNAIRVNNLRGPLTVDGGGTSNGARGGMAAIQVVKGLDAKHVIISSDTEFSAIEWGTTAEREICCLTIEGDETKITVSNATNFTNHILLFETSATFVLTAPLTISSEVIFADDSILTLDCSAMSTGTVFTAEGIDFSRIKVITASNVEAVITDSGISLKVKQESISINFVGGDSGRAGGLVPENEVGNTGIFPAKNSMWNNVVNHQSSSKVNEILFPIKESLGGDDFNTDLLFGSVVASKTYSHTESASTSTGKMLKGWLDDDYDHRNDLENATPTQITIKNIPYSNYTVYVYFSSNSKTGKFGSITLNGTTYPTGADAEGWTGWGEPAKTRDTEADFKLEENVNALKIENVTSSTLVITGSVCSADTTIRTGIAGLQIVNTGTRSSPKNYFGTLNGDANWNNGESNAGLTKNSTETISDAKVNAITITNTADEATLTFDQAITAHEFIVESQENKTLTLKKNESAAIDFDVYNFRNASGKVIVNELDNVQFIKIGKDTKINYAGTGVIDFMPNSTLTLCARDIWLGTFASADNTSRIVVDLTNEPTIEDFPLSQNSIVFPGVIELKGEVKISNDVRVYGNKNYLLGEGANFEVVTFNFGNEGSTAQTLTIDGGELLISGFIDSNTASSALFSHWPGNSRNVVVLDGALKVPNVRAHLDWDGTCAMVVGGKEDATARVEMLGITSDNRNNGSNSSITVKTNGVFQLGASGLNFPKTASRFILDGGVLSFVSDSSINIANANGVLVEYDSVIEVANGATVTIDATIAGSGALTIRKIETTDAPLTTKVIVNGSISHTGALEVGEGITLVVNGNASGATNWTFKPRAVLELGVAARPSARLTFEENSRLDLHVESLGEIVILTATGLTTNNVTLYEGPSKANPASIVDIDYLSDDRVFIGPRIPKLILPTSGVCNIRNADLWNNKTPVDAGSVMFNCVGDVTVDVNDDYSRFDSIVISGGGTVTFTGTNGTIRAKKWTIDAGTTLVLDGSQTICLALAQDNITGSGKVATIGDIDLAGNNTFTGGLEVRSGMLRTSHARGKGFGGSDNAAGDRVMRDGVITVRSGGAVDLANTKDSCYHFIIEGKGVATTNDLTGEVTYSGVLMNSGVEIPNSSRQTWHIALNGDALIRVDTGKGWGLHNNGDSDAYLSLNGHTLTKVGGGAFEVVNISQNGDSAAEKNRQKGYLIIEEGSLDVRTAQSAFRGVSVLIEAGAALNLYQQWQSEPKPSFFPTTEKPCYFTGRASYGSNNATQMSVSLGKINPARLSPGVAVELIRDNTLDLNRRITNGFFNVAAMSARFDVATVKVESNVSYSTLSMNPSQEVKNFYHYHFDNASTSFSNLKASDSTYEISSPGESGDNSETIDTRNGKALLISNNNSTPYWGNNSQSASPFIDRFLTVTAVIKPKQTDRVIPWALGSGLDQGLALGVYDDNTIEVLGWEADSRTADNVKVLATITNLPNLKHQWNFVSVRFSPLGCTLQVNDRKVTTSATLPVIDSSHAKKGQLGNAHGTPPSGRGYKKVGSGANDGIYIDDWQVYDIWLTDEEIAEIRHQYYQLPFRIYLR